jgi:hypothetical protein
MFSGVVTLALRIIAEGSDRCADERTGNQLRPPPGAAGE